MMAGTDPIPKQMAGFMSSLPPQGAAPGDDTWRRLYSDASSASGQLLQLAERLEKANGASAAPAVSSDSVRLPGFRMQTQTGAVQKADAEWAATPAMAGRLASAPAAAQPGALLCLTVAAEPLLAVAGARLPRFAGQRPVCAPALARRAAYCWAGAHEDAGSRSAVMAEAQAPEIRLALPAFAARPVHVAPARAPKVLMWKPRPRPVAKPARETR